MPLTNKVIMKLNEITNLVENKNEIKNEEIKEIKSIFNDLLKSGEWYNVEEIESWFENEGTWKRKDTRIRLTNLSHYVQSKFEQNKQLKIITNEDDTCCES